MIELSNPTIVLCNRNYDRYGQLNNIDSWRCKLNLNSADEISFNIYYNDVVNLWDKIDDLKLVWVKELDEYFEIYVSLSEQTNNKCKSITGTSLCEAELSQTKLYNLEINTEIDIDRDDYSPTVFYNPSNPKSSLLDLILEKVPHYHIDHVDESLRNIQRTFSINDTDILNAFTTTIAQEINCLFKFNSTNRGISVYDLYTVCDDCGYRGEYLDACPNCGSANLKYYGEDTTILVGVDNLTDQINYETDIGSVKNCFRLQAGDDVMTAAVISCNPNGSNYLYYFSEEQMNDMPTELIEKLRSYNNLVSEYENEYQSLTKELYDAIDKILYYQSSMMPTLIHDTVTASTEAAKLTVDNLSPISVSMLNEYTSVDTINSALKNYASIYVKTGYVKLEVENSQFDYETKIWTGRFKVTNHSDNTDIAYSDTISIIVNDDYDKFLEQKILKSIRNTDKNDEDNIFNVLDIKNIENFKQAIKLYSLNRLKSFYDATQGVIDILLEENQAYIESSYYNTLYKPYYDKLTACQEEIDVRSATINEWENRYNTLDERRIEIQSILDFEKYLGIELFKLFCAYRREDTYQNDNFISDGLDNAAIFKNAIEFFDMAKKEIVKSGERQHSIKSDINNFMKIPEFAPIVDHFELGNWIRFRVDNELYRLRLTSYEYAKNNETKFITEFSNLTKTANGVNDIKSILDSAKSVASSYSYVSRQSSKGKDASNMINKWGNDGLNSSQIKIVNSDTEQVTFDKHGILCRSYDDDENKYGAKQLKIVGNQIAMTNDNWETAQLALGEHKYIYYDSNKGEFVIANGYGLIAKFMDSPYIRGGQIIGGEIYSDNYSPTSGSHMDFRDGTFSLAGGKLRFDGKEISLSTIETDKLTDEVRKKISLGDVSTAISNESSMVEIKNNRLNIDSDNFKLFGSSKPNINGIITSMTNDGYGLMFVNGNIRFMKSYNLQDGIANNDADGIHIISNGNNITIGEQTNVGVSNKYIMNNGTEYEEKHIFIGDVKCVDSIKSPVVYFDENNNFHAGTYNETNSILSNGSLYINGSFGCSGTKNRIVSTEHYGNVSMNAVESAGAYFTDFGSGKIIDGVCYVWIDEVFAETIESEEYHVLITRTSEAKTSWVDKNQNFFIVHGEEGATFDWMISAKQKGYSSDRLESVYISNDPISYNSSIFNEDNNSMDYIDYTTDEELDDENYRYIIENTEREINLYESEE